MAKKKTADPEPGVALSEVEQAAADLKDEQDRLSNEAAAVQAEAAAKLADAKEIFDAAQAEFDAAKAEHDAALKAQEQKAILGEHVLVDLGGTGSHAVVPIPAEHRAAPGQPFFHPRTLTVSGRNVEHVDTNADGVWLYRAM